MKGGRAKWAMWTMGRKGKTTGKGAVSASSASRPDGLLNVNEEVDLDSSSDVSEDTEEERTRKTQQLRRKRDMAANKCVELQKALDNILNAIYEAESELDGAQRELKAHVRDVRRSMQSQGTITDVRLARLMRMVPPPANDASIVVDDEVGEAEA